jgi:hypothetical protein
MKPRDAKTDLSRRRRGNIAIRTHTAAGAILPDPVRTTEDTAYPCRMSTECAEKGSAFPHGGSVEVPQGSVRYRGYSRRSWPSSGRGRFSQRADLADYCTARLPNGGFWIG